MSGNSDLTEIYLHSIDIGLVVIDRQGIIRLVNRTYARLLSKETEDLMGSAYEVLLPSSEESKNALIDLIEGKTEQLKTKKAWWKNPESFIYLKGYAKDEETTKYGRCRILFLRDVSEEVLYRERMDYQAAILQNVRDSVIVTNEEGAITYCNAAATELFGHAVQEMLHQSVLTFYPDFDMDAFFEEARKQQDYFCREEWSFLRPDGQLIWADVKLSPLYRNQRISGVIAVSKEITEKKKREQELYRKQKELTSIIDSQTSFLIRTDLEGNFTYVNATFQKRFGFLGKLIGEFSMNTIIPEDHEKTYKMVEECLANPGKMVPIEIRKPKPDGKSYYTNYWEFVAISDEEGKPSEIQGVGYDITDRKINEERVVELNRFNRLLLEISTEFINISYQDIQQQIPKALKAVTKFTGFERSFVYLFDENKSFGYLTYEYHTPSVPPIGPAERVFPAEPFPWWMKKIMSGEVIQIPSLEDLPAEAANERASLQSTGIRSTVAVPIIYQNNFLGYMGFAALSENKRWNSEIVGLLKLMGSILANAFYRSHTEQQLRKSNLQYTLLAENITDIVSRHNRHLRTLYISPSCTVLLGYYPYELLGRSMKSLLHTEDVEPVEEEIMKSLEAGKGSFQARLRQKDGNFRWVESYVSVVGNNDDTELVLVSRDIQEQKLVEYDKEQLLQETQALNEELSANEEELRQNLEYTQDLNEKLEASERYYRALIHKSFDAIVVYDRQGFVKYASPSAADITGYADILGMHGSEFVVEEDLIEAQQVFEQVMILRGAHTSFQQRIRRRDGEIRWIEAVMTNQMEDEAIQGMVSNFRDITERKKAAVALEESRTSLSIAQSVSKVGSWEVSLLNNESYWSEEFYRIFALDPKQQNPNNTDIQKMIHPEDRELVNSKIDEAFRELKEIAISYRIIDTKGELKYINALNKVIRDEKGQPIKMLGTLQDVTRETELEYLLDETSRIARVGGWQFDLFNNQLTWTDETYRIHEVPQGENVAVERAVSFYHPEDTPALTKAFKQLMEKGDKYELELRLITAKGKHKWVRTTGGAHDVKDGKISRVRGSIQDITQRKRQEEVLRKYSERLTLAVKTARIGIWELDLASSKLEWNDQLLAIYGISREQFEEDYNYWKSLVHPDDRAGADAEISKVMQGESVSNVEFKVLPPDGKMRYINASAQPIYGEQGEIIRLIGVNLDVTGIKRSEEEIRNYSKRLKLATKAAQIGVWDLDVVSGQLIWDERTCEQHGLSLEQFGGRFEDWKKLVHPGDIEEVMQLFNDSMKQHYDYEAEFRIIRVDTKATRYLHANATVVKDRTGNAVGMIGVSWDITEQKENEQRILKKNEDLEKANAELDHFVYSTSHNLRAPLTSIMGIVQILSEVSSEKERQHFLSLIDRSIRKLDETIQEINDYSRNTRIEIQKTPVDFEQITQDIMESLSFMENASRIDFTIEVAEELNFYSDISRIRIIFNNLFSNAVKYMNPAEEQPFLKIKVQKEQKGVHISVQDNGIGIKSEYLKRIFDMFFRATNKASGSGLGLYIVKEAVNKLGGEISIHSAFGEGTRFDIYLPSLV